MDPVQTHRPATSLHSIIAGFGLCGRFVAELLDFHGIAYSVVDLNPATAEQCKSVPVIVGDIRDEAILHHAGIERATLVALTMPVEESVLAAIEVVRRLRPDVRIVARVNYTSAGMKAQQLGANSVIIGEQLIARDFFRVIETDLSGKSSPEAAWDGG